MMMAQPEWRRHREGKGASAEQVGRSCVQVQQRIGLEAGHAAELERNRQAEHAQRGGCEPGVVLRLENAYYLARSPHEPPPHSPRALDLARTYVHLRWLGATPGPRLRRRAWRYDELRTLGERLGLI